MRQPPWRWAIDQRSWVAGVGGRSREPPGRREEPVALTGGRMIHGAVALRALIPYFVAGCAVPPAWRLEARKLWTGPAPWLPPGVCRLAPADPADQYDTPPRPPQSDWCK